MTRCRPLLGTFVEVTADSEAAVEAAFQAIAQVHSLMSAHEQQSDIGRINRFAHLRPVEVDEWTSEVLGRALSWSDRSGGAFDIVAAGAQALASGYIPRHPDQPRPRSAHYTSIRLGGGSVSLVEAACIDVGGIAKGFAVDRAIAALKDAGAAFGLVNAGGDMAAFGPQPWPVQVIEPRSRRPVANVAVSNGAIATSSILPDGGSCHLPRRDTQILSATVCAPCAMDADALTKIVLNSPGAAGPCLDAASAQAFVLTAAGAVRSIAPEKRAA